MESQNLGTTKPLATARSFAVTQPQIIVLAHIMITHLTIGFHFGWYVDAVYLGLAVWSVRLRSTALIQLSLAMMLFRRLALILPDAIANVFPVYLLIVLAITWGLTRWRKSDPPTRAWLRRGFMDKIIGVEILTVSIASALALIAWGYWTDSLGAGEVLMKAVAGIPKPVVIAAVVPAFALLNAFSEEALFRGVFQQAALEAKFNEYAAIGLQAMPFAAFHVVAGFPNGKVGYAMTFVYACALGFLRRQTKGLLAAYLTHVTADLVIAYFLYFSAIQ